MKPLTLDPLLKGFNELQDIKGIDGFCNKETCFNSSSFLKHSFFFFGTGD
jgi:hypothetical protein